MPAQRALQEMRLRLVTPPRNPHGITGLPTSCTHTAISYFESRGRHPADYWQTWSEFYGHPESSNRKGDNFGLRHAVVERIYRKHGLVYIQAAVGLPVFPPDCILMLQDPDPDKGHVVARVDNVLHDTFDCRKRSYQIVGFYVRERAVRRAADQLFTRAPRRRVRRPMR